MVRNNYLLSSLQEIHNSFIIICFLTEISYTVKMSAGITAEVLKCKEWSGTDVFPEDELEKFVIEGLETIHNDLLRYGGWNGTKPVATLVLGVGDGGQITSTILHLLGESPDKVVEAKHLWPTAKDNHHIKVKKFDLSKITFRGSLASSYTYNFDWTYRIPSKSRPGHFHEVDPIEKGLTKLALRVLAQPWTNGMIKISAGVIPIDDITQLSNSSDFRCPLVEVFHLVIPLMPRPGSNVPIPSCPYLLDNRPDNNDKLDIPSQDAVFNTVTGFFKNQLKPNMKKSLWEKARDEDWNSGELCRYTTEDKITNTEDGGDLSDQDNLGGKQANDAMSEIVGLRH